MYPKLMFQYLMARLGCQKGQAMSEYGLVLALVAVGVVAAMVALRTQLVTVITNMTEGLKK